MRLFLVRHYKTLGNVTGEIIGWAESPPAEGSQADLAYVLQRLQAAEVDFDQIYTSDLTRARETGHIYAQGLSVDDPQHSAALNEIDYGKLSKKKKHWVEKNIARHKVDPSFVYPEGESFLQMQQRSAVFVESLVEKHAKANILIVAHAGVIRGLVCHFRHLPYSAHLKRKIGHRYIADFSFEQRHCRQYREWGVPSGFIADKNDPFSC